MVGLWFVDSSPLKKIKEAVLLFRSVGGRRLKFASNCSYELWLDGQFVGVGGHRCTHGEAYIDQFDQSLSSKTIEIRLLYSNPKTNRILYRSVFVDSFVYDFDESVVWDCSWDRSIKLGTKMSSQLSFQNIVSNGISYSMTRVPVATADQWTLIPLPISPLQIVTVQPIHLKTQAGTTVIDGKSVPDEKVDLVSIATERSNVPLTVQTYDLGMIALHRFEFRHAQSWAVFCYSEIPEFSNSWTSDNRHKVRMADAIVRSGTGSPFGQRGCRYLHVVYPSSHHQPEFVAQRVQYPLQWLDRLIRDNGRGKLVEAVKANLVACVDGGVVDTCWRERVQWTGDLRMIAKAIRTVTNSNEVIALALHQIADSYDSSVGMVQGAWPYAHPKNKMLMPLYHLAFCLSALDADPTLFDRRVRRVVHDSIDCWKRLYVRNGVVVGPPGWYFVDWDFTEESTMGRTFDPSTPHSICTMWWLELCDLIGVDSGGVTSKTIDAAFRTTDGLYRLTSVVSDPVNLHATIAALSLSGTNLDQAVRYISDRIDDRSVSKRVTAYYGYFVARGLDRVQGRSSCLKFIDEFYGPIASKHGTIYEKTSDDSSMAHGWSVGFVEFLPSENEDSIT